jgi:GNAT superfamily N-acetyltransferase
MSCSKGHQEALGEQPLCGRGRPRAHEPIGRNVPLEPAGAEFPLRRATRADASQIADVHVASWRDAYRTVLDPAFLAGPIEMDRLEAWTARLGNQQEHEQIMIAADAEVVVGFICVVGDQGEKWGQLVENLHVRPHYRGRGVGAILLKSAASWVARRYPSSGLYLWVFEANVRARNFYERLGARTVEEGVSKIPSAHGAAILRLHWPSAEGLLREDQQ